MFLWLFGSKKPLIPLEVGEIIEVKFVATAPLDREEVNPMTGEKIEEVLGGKRSGFRILYAVVSKVSKKRNIFVRFVSQDKGDNLQVGLEASISALKPKKLIGFSTRLLHRNEDVFIFSPPMSVKSVNVPKQKKAMSFRFSAPVEYRAISSPYSQRGTLTEFRWERIGFIANLLIPIGTTLAIELVIPYRLEPIHIKGKVLTCEPAENLPRKHLARLSLDEIGARDKDELIRYLLLSQQTWENA